MGVEFLSASFEMLMLLINLVLPVILCFTCVAIWKCTSAVLSMIKVSLALRNIPTPPEQHWFFGHALYCVSDRFGIVVIM